MFAAVFLVLQTLAAVSVEAQCAVNLDKPSALKGRICGRTGTLNSTEIERQYIATDFATCAENAYRDYFAASLSFASDSGECTTYFSALRNQDFQKHKKSTTSFYNTKCFHLNQSCFGLVGNPSFEDNIAGYPKNAGPYIQQIGLMPWFIYNFDNGADVSTSAYVGTNDDVPFGGDPTPDGSSFAVVGVDSEYNALLAQVVKLKPNTMYQVQFKYNFFNYDGSPSIPNGPTNDYAIIAFYHNNFYGYTSLKPDNGDANGVWRDFETRFSTGNEHRGRASIFGILFGTPDDPPNIAVRGTFGFDAVNITEI